MDNFCSEERVRALAVYSLARESICPFRSEEENKILNLSMQTFKSEQIITECLVKKEVLMQKAV